MNPANVLTDYNANNAAIHRFDTLYWRLVLNPILRLLLCEL